MVCRLLLAACVFLFVAPTVEADERWTRARITRGGVVIVDQQGRTDIRLRPNQTTGGYDIYSHDGRRLGYARPAPLTGDLELFSPDGTRGIRAPRK